MRASCRLRCGDTSAWIVIPRRARRRRSRRSSAPAPRPSGARRAAASCGARSVSITFAPNVRLGTKRPSITSTWIQSAPACSSIATSSPRRAKSALSMDGAMRTPLMAAAPAAVRLRLRYGLLRRLARRRCGLGDDAERDRHARQRSSHRLTGVCPITVPGVPGPPGSRTIAHAPHAELREHLSRRADVASHEVGHRRRRRTAAQHDRHRRRHAHRRAGGGPRADDRARAARCSAPRCTSPTSNPSFSSSTCASMRVMPVTVGTVTMRCPPLTTSVTGGADPFTCARRRRLLEHGHLGCGVVVALLALLGLEARLRQALRRLVEAEPRDVRHLHVARDHARGKDDERDEQVGEREPRHDGDEVDERRAELRAPAHAAAESDRRSRAANAPSVP